MVVYDLTKCINYTATEAGAYNNTDLFCLEEMTDKRPIKHGDTIKFPNKKEYVVEFVQGEMAVMLLKKQSQNTKKVKVSRHLPTLFYYGSSRNGNGRDQYAYELMVKDAHCFLRHGDLLVTSEDRFQSSCFVDIDKENKEFSLMINPDESGSGYFSIPIELSERVDNVFQYFSEHITYIYDNNVIIDISPRDKVFDVIFHPELLKERSKIVAYVNHGDFTISFGVKGSEYRLEVESVYKLLQENDAVKKMWRKITTLPKEVVVDENERGFLSAVYPTYTRDIHRDLWDILNDLIMLNMDAYESLQAQKKKDLALKEKTKKDLALKEKMERAASAKKKEAKVPKVHKGTFVNVNTVLSTRARNIVKDEGVTVRNVVIEAIGDDEAVKRAFHNIEHGAPTKKVETKRDKAPPGKVLNPATNRFINADGALAKKLGLVRSTPKR